MASAFWTLEDGRGFARRWSWMAHMLKLICIELKTIDEAEDFYNYLNNFVYSEDNGDEFNGFGGFIRKNENIMFNFDLRTFTPENRKFFWEATQKALTRIKSNKESQEDEGALLEILLDMNKRIKKRENPIFLNHYDSIQPNPNEKLGPGW